MKLLLDSHTLIWMVGDSAQLSRGAHAALSDTDNGLFFSVAAYWEIGVKASIGKIDLAPDWHTTLPREMARNGIRWLDIRPHHVHEVTALPWLHRDPFDRLLIAQARSEEMTLLSRDRRLAEYDVAVIW